MRAVTAQLIKNGKVEHGYLGIGMNNVTPNNARFLNLKDATGAIVSQVTRDSPASRGGVQTGDVIDQLNGEKVVIGCALKVAVSEMTRGTKDRPGHHSQRQAGYTASPWASSTPTTKWPTTAAAMTSKAVRSASRSATSRRMLASSSTCPTMCTAL